MAFKKLVSLFVNFEEEPKAQEIKTQPEEVPAYPGNNPAIEVSPEGKKNENIANDLAGALEAANIDGYDYFEFAKTIDALKPSMPSEQTLYQTAFASGAVMGATKDKLIETALHYLRILENKQEEFKEVVKAQNDALVVEKEKDITNIEELIATAAKQIQTLTEEINQLTEKKMKVANEVSANRIKIEQVRNDFTTTMQIFTGKINGDVEKINKYITPAN